MRIGEVARQSGVQASAIRYYEAQKLLTRPARSAAGYRVYAPGVLGELRFISRARRLGLTLAETREILSLGRSGKAPCARVAAICAGHLDEIARKIAELQTFRAHLERARQIAEGRCGKTSEGFCHAILADDTAHERV